jgi:hypothetical protein
MTDLIMVIQWEFLSYNFPLMFVVCVWGGGGGRSGIVVLMVPYLGDMH